jgi:tetratricopeptide (TPR) repeat protein
MLDRTLQGVEARDAQKRGFRSGVKKSFSLSSILRQLSESFGSLAVLRFRDDGGRPRLLFRAWGDGGVQYLELLVAPAGDAVRGVDLYQYSTGETMSDTCRRLYLRFLAGEPGADGILKKENEFIRNIAKVKAATEQAQSGAYAEALKTIAALPAGMQTEKSVLVLRLQSASQVGEKECAAALADFRKAFPDDPALDFLSIDALLVVKRYEEARKAIDNLDKRLGGDPYLEVLRANSYIEEGKLDLAKARAAAAIEKEKTLSEPYWTMVTISLKEKKYAVTVKWLTRIEKDLEEEVQDLTKEEDYAGFVKSPEYAAWMKAREQTKK